MRKLVLLLLVFTVLAPSVQAQEAPPVEIATVVAVVDGDTIDVEMGGQTYRVRYLGVDAPALDAPCGQRAAAANAALVQGQAVALFRDVTDTDAQGRLLRYVMAGGVFVNAHLVAQGFAVAEPLPPGAAYASYFAYLEARARAAALGCHSAGVFPTETPLPAAWWQVYFTAPVNSSDASLHVDGIDRYLVEALDRAERTIDIAAFEFNLASLTEALLRAHARGVRVRMVADGEHALEDEDATTRQLIDAGIPVVEDGRSAFMHDKFVVIDGAQVWTGSWNFTVNDTFRNNNNAMAITSPDLARFYTREFEEMFVDRAFGPASTSVYEFEDLQTTTVAGTPLQVYFGPEDDVGDWIALAVKEARTSVRFMAFAFTHEQIGQAVLDRAQAGVPVAGIFEQRGSETASSLLAPMLCAGLPVRQDGNPRTFHHKVFILDDETVILGSFNFTASADDSNDENALIITNAEIAAQYNAEFDRRWAEAKTPEGIVCEAVSTPTATSEPTPLPTETALPPVEAWVCAGDTYNCGEFRDRCDELCDYWRACPGDPSRLDPNDNGWACEGICPRCE